MLNFIIACLPYVGVAILFYLWIIRPPIKQKKTAAAAIKSLAKGDEIMTVGGIFGVVVSIDEITLIMQTPPDNTKMRLDKTYIKTIKKHDGTIINVY